MKRVVWSLIVCLYVWTVSVNSVNGYCFKDPIKFQRTVSGRVRKYCEYKHPPVVNKDAGNIIMFPDSSVFTGDCLACTCTMEGLTCCGFGHQEINFNLPSDCTQLQDGCHGLHVKTNNNSLDCFTGEPISFDTLEPHPDNIFSLPSLVAPGGTKVIKVKDADVIKKEIPVIKETIATEPPTHPTTKSTTTTTTTTTPEITRKPEPTTTKHRPSKPVNHHEHHKQQQQQQQEHQTTSSPIKREPTIPLGQIPIVAEKVETLSPIVPEPNRPMIPLGLPQINPQAQRPTPVIVPQPTANQFKLVPVHDFGRQAVGGLLQNSVQQIRYLSAQQQQQQQQQKYQQQLNQYQQQQQRNINPGFRMIQNTGNTRLQWTKPTQGPYPTITPPPFLPVPYGEPAREDSGSSSNSFSDFLFRMMMFGAFA